MRCKTQTRDIHKETYDTLSR